jgi:hypothetical protein
VYGLKSDVLFGSTGEANEELAVAFKVALVVGGLVYPSAEHCFQVRPRLRAPSELPVWRGRVCIAAVRRHPRLQGTLACAGHLTRPRLTKQSSCSVG